MSAKMQLYVIGGGAAGYFGAIRAADCFPQAKVTILEKSSRVLQKVKVSGGGRCNVTHQPHAHSQFARNYPRGDKFLKKTLGKFSAADIIAWFNQRGLQLHTEADGRVFPQTNKAESVIACFEAEAKRLGIRVERNAGIQAIERKGEQYVLKGKTNNWLADRVLIAIGGHAKVEAYDWLRKLGHNIIPPIPSLFTFNLPESSLRQLAGISVPDAQVQLQGVSYQYSGPLLITHWGISGPAVLKLSAYAADWLHKQNYQATVLIRWVSESVEDKVRDTMRTYALQHGQRLVYKYPLYELPQRLWNYLCKEAGISDQQRWLDLSKKEINRLLEMLYRQPQQLQGKTTFKEEFVSCGGIPLDEINPLTLESKLVPGVFFAGEVLNIDGITGGFNFQSAWTTAWLAGTHLGK